MNFSGRPHVLLSLIAAGAAHGVLAAECQVAKVLQPAAASTIATLRPELAWQAVPEVKRYRVQLESRVPEGQVVARMDTVIEGTRTVPPTALASSRAAVKLLVTADCSAETPSVTARRPHFFIDATATCRSPDALDSARGMLTWERVGDATGYAVTAFARDGKVLLRDDVRTPQARIPAGAAYASVRTLCASGVSPLIYRALGDF